MGNEKKRLIYLMKILQNTDEMHTMTATRIVSRLRQYGEDTCVRTISNDIAALREAGYRIQVHNDRRQGHYLAEHRLTNHEAKLLGDMVAQSPFLTEKDTYALLQKLQCMSSPTAAALIRRTCSVDPEQKSRSKYNTFTLEAILTAISRGRKVRFSYFRYILGGVRVLCKRSDGSRYYYVSPYCTPYYHGHYYLLGNLDGYEDISTFRLENICDISLSGETARSPHTIEKLRGFKPVEYLRQTVDMFGGKPARLTLLYDGKAGTAVRDQFGYALMERDMEDGRFKVHVTVLLSEGVYRWLMAHSDEITVLEPASVRADMRERFLRCMHDYENA